jgi:pimeloyl-ACP methyl ester carboxylesterase
VVIDGIRTPLREAGPATESEAVVFVHGNPGSSADWSMLLARAGEFARAIAMDMPGFGHVDKPDDFDYSVSGYARHLAHILDACGVRRAHLVLHDFGGPWGLAWAAANPQAVGSVTLVNTGVLRGYRWHYLARIWQTPLLGELFMAATTRTGMRLLLRHGNPRGLPSAFLDQMYENFDTGTRRAVLKLYRNTRDAAGAMQALGQALAPLNLPALVIWGAHDPYLPVRLAQQQRDCFAHAEVVVLPGSGHWPFIDDPESVARAVIPFLRAHCAVVQS